MSHVHSLNRTRSRNWPPSHGYAGAGGPPLRDQVPLLTLVWLAFVLSRVLDRLALSPSRPRAVTLPAAGWLTRLRSRLEEVRGGTVLSPVGAVTERNWFARPLSRLLAVLRWLLLPWS